MQLLGRAGSIWDLTVAVFGNNSCSARLVSVGPFKYCTFSIYIRLVGFSYEMGCSALAFLLDGGSVL